MIDNLGCENEPDSSQIQESRSACDVYINQAEVRAISVMSTRKNDVL